MVNITIIAELPKNSTIKDFDVLFNPDYQIDVLQLLIAACKKREFSIIWSGTYSNGKLMYAEPGYADFKTYLLNNDGMDQLPYLQEQNTDKNPH